MEKFLRKVATLYISINKKTNYLIEKAIHKEIEKEKRRYLKEYQLEATPSEVMEIKKQIVMRKALPPLLLLIIAFMGLIILIS